MVAWWYVTNNPPPSPLLGSKLLPDSFDSPDNIPLTPHNLPGGWQLLGGDRRPVGGKKKIGKALESPMGVRRSSQKCFRGAEGLFFF